MIVLARGLPIHDVLPGSEDGVASGRAACANAFGLFQKPDPHFEPEIGRGQRADRTNINGIERIIILEALARVRGQNGMTAAIDEAEDVVVRHFVAEANTT